MLVPAAGMRVVRFSSENTGNNRLARNAVDGDPGTVWHTRFQPDLARGPHVKPRTRIALAAAYAEAGDFRQAIEFHGLPNILFHEPGFSQIIVIAAIGGMEADRLFQYPDGTIRLLVQGLARIKVEEYTEKMRAVYQDEQLQMIEDKQFRNRLKNIGSKKRKEKKKVEKKR